MIGVAAFITRWYIHSGKGVTIQAKVFSIVTFPSIVGSKRGSERKGFQA